MEKAREFQKNIYFCFIDYAKALDCMDHNKLWKILKEGNSRPPDLPLEKNPMPGHLSELHPVNEVNTKGQPWLIMH